MKRLNELVGIVINVVGLVMISLLAMIVMVIDVISFVMIGLPAIIICALVWWVSDVFKGIDHE